MEYKTGLLLALAVQFFGTGDGKCKISQNQYYSTSFIKLRGLIKMSPALIPSAPQHTDTSKDIKAKREREGGGERERERDYLKKQKKQSLLHSSHPMERRFNCQCTTARRVKATEFSWGTVQQ